jgi:hypothetical protein
LASRTTIRRPKSPDGSCNSAISDLPGPANAPLAATLEPTTPTDRTSVSGRGVGVGLGVGADAIALEGSGLGDGKSEQEQTVSAAIDRASNLTATEFTWRRMILHGYQVLSLRGSDDPLPLGGQPSSSHAAARERSVKTFT